MGRTSLIAGIGMSLSAAVSMAADKLPPSPWSSAEATPLASPALHPNSMKSFPPTLVLSAIRDPSLSASVFTHRQLYSAGVQTELHVWEGVGHCFSSNPDLPESHDLYRVLTRFFERHTASRAGK